MAAPTIDELRVWVLGDGAAPDPGSSTMVKLAEALDSATTLVESACLAQYVDSADADFVAYPAPIHTAILIRGHAIYARAQSPQGVAGFDTAGNLFRVTGRDPDVGALLARYLDLAAMFA